MNADEIVVHKVDRQCAWFSAFFEKAFVNCVIRRLPNDIEVLALGKRCADALRIGVAFDRMLACASANRGAIAPLSFSRGTINLDQHSIINLGAERALTASR